MALPPCTRPTRWATAYNPTCSASPPALGAGPPLVGGVPALAPSDGTPVHGPTTAPLLVDANVSWRKFRAAVALAATHSDAPHVPGTRRRAVSVLVHTDGAQHLHSTHFLGKHTGVPRRGVMRLHRVGMSVMAPHGLAWKGEVDLKLGGSAVALNAICMKPNTRYDGSAPWETGRSSVQGYVPLFQCSGPTASQCAYAGPPPGSLSAAELATAAVASRSPTAYARGTQWAGYLSSIVDIACRMTVLRSTHPREHVARPLAAAAAAPRWTAAAQPSLGTYIPPLRSQCKDATGVDGKTYPALFGGATGSCGAMYPVPCSKACPPEAPVLTSLKDGGICAQGAGPSLDNPVGLRAAMHGMFLADQQRNSGNTGDHMQQQLGTGGLAHVADPLCKASKTTATTNNGNTFAFGAGGWVNSSGKWWSDTPEPGCLSTPSMSCAQLLGPTPTGPRVVSGYGTGGAVPIDDLVQYTSAAVTPAEHGGLTERTPVGQALRSACAIGTINIPRPFPGPSDGRTVLSGHAGARAGVQALSMVNPIVQGAFNRHLSRASGSDLVMNAASTARSGGQPVSATLNSTIAPQVGAALLVPVPGYTVETLTGGIIAVTNSTASISSVLTMHSAQVTSLTASGGADPLVPGPGTSTITDVQGTLMAEVSLTLPLILSHAQYSGIPAGHMWVTAWTLQMDMVVEQQVTLYGKVTTLQGGLPVHNAVRVSDMHLAIGEEGDWQVHGNTMALSATQTLDPKASVPHNFRQVAATSTTRLDSAFAAYPKGMAPNQRAGIVTAPYASEHGAGPATRGRVTAVAQDILKGLSSPQAPAGVWAQLQALPIGFTPQQGSVASPMNLNAALTHLIVQKSAAGWPALTQYVGQGIPD